MVRLMSQLEKLKLKLGSVDASDELLDLFLSDAEEFILETTHLAELPERLLSSQVDLAIIAYNKQGIEGQSSHSEGGISRTFEGIPDSIMRKIKSCRRLPR